MSSLGFICPGRKIVSSWYWLGNSTDQLTLDEYLLRDTIRQNMIRNHDVDLLVVSTFDKSGALQEDNGDYVENFKYELKNNKSTLTVIGKKKTHHYKIILLNKTDLILYDTDKKRYDYYVKKTHVFSRFE
ncbi:MAG: hypothetical protein ACO1O6_08390 [Bacteroidota bacterium]